MLEQDVELAKLLVAKTTELDQRSSQIESELRAVELKLSELEGVRSERSSYEDILSRAASLLGRTDLQVDSPETAELEERAGELRAAHSEVEVEAEQYRGLLDELRGRAPKLVAAALGHSLPEDEDTSDGAEDEESGPFEAQPRKSKASLAAEDEILDTDVDAEADDEEDEEALRPLDVPLSLVPQDFDPEAEDFDEDEAAEQAAALAEAPAAGSNGSAPHGAQEPADLSLAGLPAMERGQANVALDDRLALLSRFNLPLIKTKAASDRGMAFVIDCLSVMDRVPFYDRQRLAMDDAGARDELVRDISVLGSEVQGGFHLVFPTPHVTRVMHDANLLIEAGSESADGYSATAQRIQELVSVYVGQGIPVSVVSGDGYVSEAVKKVGGIMFQLGEFFST